MKVVILIPTYNEKENIGKLLKQISKMEHTILIVDDNSPDGTGNIVKEFMSKNKKIYLLSHKKEGLGKAMIRGYKYALKNLKPDIVITNEADFGFEFSLMPKMIKKIIQGFDVVVASRHIGNGRADGWTVSRKLNHFIANTVFARLVAGVSEIYDKNGAFRAIRVKGVLEKVNFNKFPTTGFSFFFYLIYELSKITNKFYEIPATFNFRTRGETKVSFNPKYLRVYLSDIIEYIRNAFLIRLERSNINLWQK